MGFLGLNKEGFVTVVAEKNIYTTGEIVSGVAHVDIIREFQCRNIVLFCKGKEETKWTEQRTRTKTVNGKSQTEHYTEHYYGEHVFFHAKIVLFTSVENGVMSPGNYSFPFQFQLAPDLPGSIDFSPFLSTEKKATICYYLKAKVDVKGFFNKDLTSKQYLTVIANPNLNVAPVHPIAFEHSQTVRFLCCFDQGKVDIQKKLNKNAYVSNEDISISFDVNNRSSKEIKEVTIDLKQCITLKANSSIKSIDQNLARVRTTNIILPNSNLNDNFLYKLTANKSYHTHASTLISCEYYLVTTCHFSMCPSIKLVAPILIKPGHLVEIEQNNAIPEAVVVSHIEDVNVKRESEETSDRNIAAINIPYESVGSPSAPSFYR